MGWVLTKGLQNLRAQVGEAFPDRDKASDGTVGDLAHQVGTSGHNPDLTGKAEYRDGDSLDEVRAWDMDTDLRAAPATAQQVVDHIRRLPNVHDVLRYMIYNRKIYRASTGWAAEAYDGPSPHTEHIHFSGAFSQAADNDTTFDYRLEEIPVALTDSDFAKLTAMVDKRCDQIAADVLTKFRQTAEDLSDTERTLVAAEVLTQKIEGTSVGTNPYKRGLNDLVPDLWQLVVTGRTKGGDPVPKDGVYGQILAGIADIKAALAAKK